jgi:hypothetical protein
VDSIGRRLYQHLAEVRKAVRNPKPLTELPGHQKFLITKWHNLAIRHAPDSGHVLVGDFAAADYSDTKHGLLLSEFELR